MKTLLFITSLIFISCTTPNAPDSDCFDAEYIQFISYQQTQAHRFQTNSKMFFFTGEFHGTIGESYNICVDNDTVISVK